MVLLQYRPRIRGGMYPPILMYMYISNVLWTSPPHLYKKQNRPFIDKNGLPEDFDQCIQKLSSRRIFLAM